MGSDVERGEVEEEEMDEESEYHPCFYITYNNTSTLAQAKHEAFIKARGRHYSNEAEAMKVGSSTLLFCLSSSDVP